ncbi:MAG: 2OG-Fe(II) oxygenase [Candidatus Pacebacteria bacterium]|nr:2OG-Fe(II) oxygenase [Candidatus Paceibacterota bacterium]
MISDFIEVYKNYAPDKLCDHLVALFDRTLQGKSEDSKYLYNDAYRTDYQILLDKIEDQPVLTVEVNSVLDRAAIEYRNKFITSLGKLNYMSWRIKLQKTPIGGGFHDWHCEADDPVSADRVLTWAIYLNDLPDGEGETEFIHYGKKIKPSKGDVLIFPASFTHTHRGNPPITREKYIATGWWHLTK